MSGIFLGIGHGIRPNGTYDPGAVNPDDHAVEHDLARRVVYHATLNLRAREIRVVSESDMGVHRDPDYIGSTKTVNSSHVHGAIEVHFDWYRGQKGGSGLYYGDDDHELANYLHNAWKAHDLPTADNVFRPGLYFPKACTVPAIIYECGVVAHRSESTLASMGYALANGIEGWLRQR